MQEKEIRPKKIFNKFLKLAKVDVNKYFKKKRKKIKCIACNRNGKFSFKKHNFSYYLCKNCKTLFVNPRPIESEFINYYTKSSSIKSLANLVPIRRKLQR